MLRFFKKRERKAQPNQKVNYDSINLLKIQIITTRLENLCRAGVYSRRQRPHEKRREQAPALRCICKRRKIYYESNWGAMRALPDGR